MKFIFTPGREGISKDGVENMSEDDLEEIKRWFKEHVPLYSDMRIQDGFNDESLRSVEIEIDVKRGVAGAFLPDAHEENDGRPTSEKAEKRRASKNDDGCVVVKMEADAEEKEKGYKGVMISKKHPLFLSTILTLYFPSLQELWAPENRLKWLKPESLSEFEIGNPEEVDGADKEDFLENDDPVAEDAGGVKKKKPKGMTLREFATNILLRGGPETEVGSGETRFRRGWRGTQKVIVLIASILEDEFFTYQKFVAQKCKAEENKGTYIGENYPGGIQDYKQSYSSKMSKMPVMLGRA